MKKQKRDMQERAFARGYRAGVERRSKDLAPPRWTGSRRLVSRLA